MFSRRTLLITAATLAAGGTIVAACAGDREAPSAISERRASTDAHGSHNGIHNGELTPAQKQGVAQVRNATARFHSLAFAQRAGYTEQFPPGCAASDEGAQGFHYLNPDLVDDQVELLRPELVMYEPGPNGQLQLVGVDYIVPLSASEEPPTLLGVPFGRLEGLGVWALHIWAWRPNPSGMFAAWNPRVSCRYAAD